MSLDLRLVTLFLAMLLSTSCAAAGTAGESGNCKEGDDPLGRLKWAVRAARDDPSNGGATRLSTHCVVEVWRARDGYIVFETSDAFLAILEISPRVFLTEMAQHSREAEEWLKVLPAGSFTWFRDPPSPLEEKRRRLIALVEALKELPPDPAELRDKLLKVLKATRPRQVD